MTKQELYKALCIEQNTFTPVEAVTEAGDGINGKIYSDVSDALAAIVRYYGECELDEENFPGSPRNLTVVYQGDEQIGQILPLDDIDSDEWYGMCAHNIHGGLDDLLQAAADGDVSALVEVRTHIGLPAF